MQKKMSGCALAFILLCLAEIYWRWHWAPLKSLVLAHTQIGLEHTANSLLKSDFAFAFPLQVMIFELADYVQSFLSEYNKPPLKSFHEEMLKNQQKEQERLALEEERRIQDLRRKEEQMVRAWNLRYLSCPTHFIWALNQLESLVVNY